jgi:4-amino-4-deoxy-L-arabinose transferase-like glycosyltransferase
MKQSAQEKKSTMNFHGPVLLRARFGAALAIYGAVLLSLVPVRPFWLDEVIQLTATWNTTPGELLEQAAQNAGGAPLGYLFQHWILSILGFGFLGARLPSVLLGVGSLGLLVVLGSRLRLRWPGIAAAMWVLTPLMLRYALEGRPYMQGMFFALLSVVLQLELRKSPTIAWATAVSVSLAAALYSQPYALFAPFGFAVASVLQQRNRRYFALTLGAYAIAVLTFLPWLLAAERYWGQAIAMNGGAFVFEPSLVLLIARELAGDGYLASIPLLVLASYCLGQPASRTAATPLAAAVFSSILLALIADALFNYFFAIRQLMYLIPFLVMLSADGAAALWRRNRGVVMTLLLVFTVGSMGKNVGYLRDRNEDWQRLSEVIRGNTDAGCVLLDDSRYEPYYALFVPEINKRICSSALAGRVILPVHTYSNIAAVNAARSRLVASGFRQARREGVGFGTAEIYERP